MDIECPYCNVRLSIHPSQAGSAVACPTCGGKFQVPLPSARAARSLLHEGQPASREFSDKKIAAGICGILVGALGIHKFILGFNTAGIIMLVVSIVGSIFIIPPFVMAIIGLIEGILYLQKSDAEFYQSYAVRKKEWF